MRIALITGASSGLGREYARMLDREELDEIWLVARRWEKMMSLEGELVTPCRLFPLDLTEEKSFTDLKGVLDMAEDVEIVWLINAAGVGYIGEAGEEPEKTARLISLNCRAAAVVTELALPYMAEGGHIMEICSTAAFQPIPYLAAYAASKAFLLSYSRALREELRPRKISVTAVCPYWIKDTEFIGKAAGEARTFPFSTTAKTVARRSLSDAAHGYSVSTPDVVSTLHRMAVSLFPAWLTAKVGKWYMRRFGGE